MPAVTHLFRYPVKGLSPEPLARAGLAADAFFPDDRLYAIENGPSGFDPAAPVHMPKIKFLMLMRNAALARLRTRYDAANGHLGVTAPDGGAIGVDLRTAEGRAALETFLGGYCPADLRGTPKVVEAPNWRFTDSRSGFVSIIGLASLREIAAAAGRPVEPERFRANIYVDGVPAWSEFDWVGKRIRVGGAVLVGLKRTDRCAATEVNPATGERDIRMVHLLEERFGHHDTGIYARVESSGAVAVGDSLSVLGDAPSPSGTERASLPF